MNKSISNFVMEIIIVILALIAIFYVGSIPEVSPFVRIILAVAFILLLVRTSN